MSAVEPNTARRGSRSVDDDVTLGEVYRLVLAAIQQLTGIGSRLDGLDQKYVRTDLYDLQRKSDRQEVESLEKSLTDQANNKRMRLAGVIVPLITGALGAGVALILFAAERH